MQKTFVNVRAKNYCFQQTQSYELILLHNITISSAKDSKNVQRQTSNLEEREKRENAEASSTL